VAVCSFCDIASGASEAFVVYEDDVSLAFLDHRPLFPGHSLLIPRDHHETLADLPSALVGPYFSAAQTLALAIEAAMEAQGTFVAVNNKVSQSVPHLHVHVVPRRRRDGLRGFFWPRSKYSGEREMESVADRIRGALGRAASP
jgi:histidine triad (HIT) family protein